MEYHLWHPTQYPRALQWLLIWGWRTAAFPTSSLQNVRVSTLERERDAWNPKSQLVEVFKGGVNEGGSR